MIFSQFPRPGLHPLKIPDSDQPKMSEIRVMGYSVRWRQFRYAEWVAFDHRMLIANFSTVYAQELYDHTDDQGENRNVASAKPYRGMVTYLSGILRDKFD